jgi:hypothetical protein
MVDPPMQQPQVGSVQHTGGVVVVAHFTVWTLHTKAAEHSAVDVVREWLSVWFCLQWPVRSPAEAFPASRVAVSCAAGAVVWVLWSAAAAVVSGRCSTWTQQVGAALLNWRPGLVCICLECVIGVGAACMYMVPVLVMFPVVAFLTPLSLLMWGCCRHAGKGSFDVPLSCLCVVILAGTACGQCFCYLRGLFFEPMHAFARLGWRVLGF